MDEFTATIHELFELAAISETEAATRMYLQTIIDSHYIDDIDFALAHHGVFSNTVNSVNCTFDLNLSGWKFDPVVMKFLDDKHKVAKLSNLIINELNSRISGGYKEISCEILPKEYVIRISVRRTL